MSEWRRVTNTGRRDANEPSVIEALEAAGCHVIQLARPVDLLVSLPNDTLEMAEVKDGDARLTKAEEQWWTSWRGRRPWILRSAAEARAWVKAQTEEEA